MSHCCAQAMTIKLFILVTTTDLHNVNILHVLHCSCRTGRLADCCCPSHVTRPADDRPADSPWTWKAARRGSGLHHSTTKNVRFPGLLGLLILTEFLKEHSNKLFCFFGFKVVRFLPHVIFDQQSVQADFRADRSPHSVEMRHEYFHVVRIFQIRDNP